MSGIFSISLVYRKQILHVTYLFSPDFCGMQQVNAIVYFWRDRLLSFDSFKHMCLAKR